MKNLVCFSLGLIICAGCVAVQEETKGQKTDINEATRLDESLNQENQSEIKSCPECARQFKDRALLYCPYDGEKLP